MRILRLKLSLIKQLKNKFNLKVLSNAKNKFARCFTNLSYALWILGVFSMNYYSTILPKHPLYDYIHYRNYFLITTIVVILLQDLNFIRIKFSQNPVEKNLKTISLKQFNNQSGKSYMKPSAESGELDFVENAFDTGITPKFTKKSNDNEEEEVCFDVEEYNTQGKSKLSSYSENVLIDPKISMNYSKFSRFQRYIENNSTNLIILFAITLFILYMFATIFFLKLVMFSYYKYITLFVHPIIILISIVFKNYVCRFF